MGYINRGVRFGTRKGIHCPDLACSLPRGSHYCTYLKVICSVLFLQFFLCFFCGRFLECRAGVWPLDSIHSSPPKWHLWRRERGCSFSELWFEQQVLDLIFMPHCPHLGERKVLVSQGLGSFGHWPSVPTPFPAASFRSRSPYPGGQQFARTQWGHLSCVGGG